LLLDLGGEQKVPHEEINNFGKIDNIRKIDNLGKIKTEKFQEVGEAMLVEGSSIILKVLVL
jgi:hypothetical protein